MLDPSAHPRYRWVILVIGVLAQAATCTFIYGLPTLVPALRSADQLTLLQASLVISAPTAGLLLTLILWGAAADRYGERIVMASGTGMAALLLAVSTQLSGVGPLCIVLGLAGAAGASVNAASGRVVMGWFAVNERGLAMGARQTAQPLGVAIAALTLPLLAHRYSVAVALAFPAVFCGLIAVVIAFCVVDPPRPAPKPGERVGSPYREATIWRIHASSACLVVPQFAISAFTLVYLVGERDWTPVDAGRLIFIFQLAGAFGRIGSGVWSDRVASRLRPMRQLAVASMLLMLALVLGSITGQAWILVAFGLAAIVTVADNGLAYTSVAEMAGPAWTGRALGVQNTGQNIASLITAPVLAVVIGSGSNYAGAFLLAAALPALAIGLIPVRAEQREAELVNA
ncbi:sugar phosphate permease [Jatrophihabitans sp. GAS493]|uniref:MFS transporter n=1 Tax=Jatrophihabitans sp. GAS493 TaxID=1907575 RepID=UPI000BB940E6|nr:MFS transporter [Jatrophihabitans sp. GAS493]SOD71756.1 sugar phosphate permease [Jatrophihabitans sp. GAS493]